MLLSEISYTEAGAIALEELATWGVHPLKQYLYLFSEFFCKTDNSRAHWLYEEMFDRVDLLEKTVTRLAFEMHGERQAKDQNKDLIECLPDDVQVVAMKALKDIHAHVTYDGRYVPDADRMAG